MEKQRFACVYLAAGNSARFGSNKLLYKLDGKAMYRHGLDRLREVLKDYPDVELFVISQYMEILNELESDVHGIYSPDSRLGASYTVRKALENLKDYDGLAFFVGDQPYMTEDTIRLFIAEMRAQIKTDPNALGCIYDGEKTGNPVFFSKEYYGELMELTGDSGGKRVLKKHMDHAILIPVRNLAETKDIDRYDCL